MSFSSKLTLYDFLCMLVTGVLFMLIITPETTYTNKSNPDISQFALSFLFPFIYFVCSYIIGLIWHKFIECLLASKSLDNLFKHSSMVIRSFCRCNISLIKLSKEKVDREFTSASLSPDIKKEYYKAYYQLIEHNALGCVPILEAQAAFIRDIILPVVTIGLMLACGRWTEIVSFLPRCIGIVIILVSIIILPIVHYGLQLKIYELIWEGNHFINNSTKKV